MDDNSATWREYYNKALSRSHATRTEFAVRLNESGLQVAVDCGCGAGSDIKYLASKGYQVNGFDNNSDSVSISHKRFANNSRIMISQASFEDFTYPDAGIVIANSSLYFADPSVLVDTWANIESSIVNGGVFAGDFMGINDSWAEGFRILTAPLTQSQIMDLFTNFDIIQLIERDGEGVTSMGKVKHWNTYSVVAVKRTKNRDME